VNFRNYSVIALSVLLIGLGGYALLDARSSNRKGAHTSGLETTKREAYVRRLEERLEALENRSHEDRLLRLQEREARPSADEALEEASDNATADPEGNGAPKEKVDFRTAYDSVVTSEGTDPVWSSNREVEITGALQQLNLPGLSLTKVVCARTLCELNLARTSEFQADSLNSIYSRIHPKGNFFTDTDEKTGNLVVFVARDGELPPVGAQDG
jgi:hypothetical protein